jgi:hypothetical protein
MTGPSCRWQVKRECNPIVLASEPVWGFLGGDSQAGDGYRKPLLPDIPPLLDLTPGQRQISLLEVSQGICSRLVDKFKETISVPNAVRPGLFLRRLDWSDHSSTILPIVLASTEAVT